MPSDEENVMESLLRRCFKRESLKNSKEMLVSVLKESNQHALSAAG